MKQYLTEVKALQKLAGITESQESLEVGDRILVTYGNEYYGHTGTVEDVKGGFVVVSIDDIDGEFSMHSSDVKKIEDDEEADNFYDDDYGSDNPDDDYGPVTDWGKRRQADDDAYYGKNESKERPGLWANIRAQRARGERPAPKGSKAYNKAVKAAKEINKNK